MVAIHRRLFLLLLLGVIFAMTATAAPPYINPDEEMIQHSIGKLGTVYADSGVTYAPVNAAGKYRVYNFEEKAWDMAHGGATYVGTRQHFRGGQKYGQPWKYFYSIIPPDTPLGREMGLPDHKLATVLWRYGNGRKSMVDLQEADNYMHHSGFNWNGMQELKDVIGHH